jgi:hypothetical protein
VQAIFLAAVQSRDPAKQAEVLNAQCAGDNELRARVDALLQAHEKPTELPGVERSKVAAGSRATVNDSTSAPAGRMIAGRYRLLEEIGEGGMGTVWAAEQLQPVRRRVAIKLIKPGMDSRQVLSRFETERQALARAKLVRRRVAEELTERLKSVPHAGQLHGGATIAHVIRFREFPIRQDQLVDRQRGSRRPDFGLICTWRSADLHAFCD